MNSDAVYFCITIAVGLGATLVMDLWSIFLSRVSNIPIPNYCLVGRWIRYMPDGIFRHSSITAAPGKSAECMVGWIAHYAIGSFYALLLIAFTSYRWLREPTPMPAMILGIVTVAVPFLVMQPSFGLGVASSKTPDPAQARLRSLVIHAVFGFGLYISAKAIGLGFRAYA